MQCVSELSQAVGIARACEVLGVPRASFYRWQSPAEELEPRPSPPRALSPEERRRVLDTLYSEEFRDQAPAEVYATLLDREAYLCSVRTMYRILDENGEVRDRRDQLRHPAYRKPELLATGPNQVWTWDITKLLGPVKWTYYYLYVILDIFSRYVPGWLIAERESAALSTRTVVPPWPRSPWRSSLRISESRSPTVGLTSPMTTRSRRRSSRPSSTGRSSPSASAPWRMPEPSRGVSSAGITTSTGTGGSRS